MYTSHQNADDSLKPTAQNVCTPIRGRWVRAWLEQIEIHSMQFN